LARRVLTWTGAVLVAALVAGLNFYQLPVVTLLPGPVEDVLPQVKVSGPTRTYAVHGSLYLTTVGVDERVNFYEALLDFADRDVQVVPRSVLYPDGQTEQETDLQNAAEMDNSKMAATVVGLRRAGLKVDTDPDGVRIAGVLPGSAADGHLQADDKVLAVGGVAVRGSEDIRTQIGKARIGQKLAFKVQRGSAVRTEVVVPRQAPDDRTRPYVGVSLADIFDFPVHVDIQTENIGGPSAGLMFALSIVEKLGPEDLTRDRKIAGTGTIDYDGNVGPIGGIQQKLIAARRTGATIFLCPSDNYAEAKQGKPRGLELIPVKTIDEALIFLRRNDSAAAAPAP
jgi:PDZ domain-containing protein